MPRYLVFSLLCATCAQLTAAPQLRDSYFESKGVRIHYAKAGRGEPVVLLHGATGSIQTWVDCRVLPALALDFRVIAMDFRGHGKSDKPHDPKLYGREMGLDVVRLLDHLGIKRAHIVGYSMGSMIAAQLLTLHPERIASATLGGAAARIEWSEKDDVLYATGAEETERLGFSPTMRAQTVPATAPKLSPEQVKEQSERLMANPNHDRFAMAAAIRSFRDQAVSLDEIARVKVPVMGVVGSDDPLLANLNKVKAVLPSMRLVTIEGGTHAGQNATPKKPEFVAAIRDFISRNASSSSSVLTAAPQLRDAYFDSNGVRVHYTEAGTGEPLVLLHGRGDSIQNWLDNGVLMALARDFRVIAMDFRGHGKSAKPRDPKQYGRDMGLDVVRLLDHLGIRRAHVATYSMGATIASHLLTTHEERFITATLGAGGPRSQWTDADTAFFETGAAETERYGFSPTTRNASLAGTAVLTPEDIELESKKWLSNPDHDRFAMAALMRATRDRLTPLDDLAKIKIPVMGLVGTNDPQLANLKKLKEVLPAMKLVVIQGGTHTGPNDSRKKPEFAAAIRDFILQEKN